MLVVADTTPINYLVLITQIDILIIVVHLCMYSAMHVYILCAIRV